MNYDQVGPTCVYKYVRRCGRVLSRAFLESVVESNPSICEAFICLEDVKKKAVIQHEVLQNAL